MNLTNKKITIIVVIAIVVFTIYKCIGAYNQAIHANDIDKLNYSAERLLAENGFYEANEYVNSIYGESFSIAMNLVYEDAIETYDLQHRFLSAAIFCSSATQNHLYMYYGIPIKDSPHSVYYTTMEMVNLERDASGVYHCTQIYIYTDPDEAWELMEEALNTNAATLELDGNVRRQIDYGIVYNENPTYYNLVFNAEKTRLTNYLLSVQEGRMGDYSFSTNPEINGVPNNGSYIIDIEKYFITDVPETVSANSVSGNSVSQNDAKDDSKDNKKEGLNGDLKDKNQEQNDSNVEDANENIDEDSDANIDDAEDIKENDKDSDKSKDSDKDKKTDESNDDSKNAKDLSGGKKKGN